MTIHDSRFDIFAPTEHVSLHARRKQRVTARVLMRRTIDVLGMLLMLAVIYFVAAALCAVGPC